MITRLFRHSYRPVLEALEDRFVPSGIDPILEWNAVALQANAVDHTLPGGTQTGPTRTGRALAIVHVAMFDAFNSIAQRFTPYLTLVRDAHPGASIDAAVAQAAHDTLAALYPKQQADFTAALGQTLARVPDGFREDQGVRIGRIVAQHILAARAHDGSDVDPPYSPVPGPGVHVVDPLHPNQGYYAPGYGAVRPFSLTSSTQFPAPPPPALSSPEYAAAFQEVKTLGGDGVLTATRRTAEQTQIGIFWGYDGSPGLGTPPRLYNQITRTLAIGRHNTLAENARLFALVNVAMADAGIAAWEVKYRDNFWRPIMGIREADNDGNPLTQADPSWKYLGAPRSNAPGQKNFTPPFPAYTSGHATFGASMFRTLANYYGRDDIHFSVASDEFNGTTVDQDGTVRPVVTRSYTSFSQASEENGQSRIYLGIHWSFDKVEGIRQGNAIADYVFANFFRPLTGRNGVADGGGSVSATSPPRVQTQTGVGLSENSLDLGILSIGVVEVAAALPFVSPVRPTTESGVSSPRSLNQLAESRSDAVTFWTDDLGHLLGDDDNGLGAGTLGAGTLVADIDRIPGGEASHESDALFEWLARGFAAK